MRLTTKGRFAVTAMIDVNRYQQGGPVSLAGISERQDISVAYLEQLFSKLRRGNLVKSIRGPGGGYVLAKDAADITIADTVFASGSNRWMSPVAAGTATAQRAASSASPIICGPVSMKKSSIIWNPSPCLIFQATKT